MAVNPVGGPIVWFNFVCVRILISHRGVARHHNIVRINMGTKPKGNIYAAIRKPLFERERLKDPNEDVEYFKNALRPHFAKGIETAFTFLWYQVPRFRTGSERLPKVGGAKVFNKRIVDAWTDLRQRGPS